MDPIHQLVGELAGASTPQQQTTHDDGVEQLTAPASGDRPARAGDGVSPILITANDLAGAWAITPDGGYMFPTVPNDPYQREMALRAGINIAVYTMTGNYKADQVHIPALLERLGQ